MVVTVALFAGCGGGDESGGFQAMDATSTAGPVDRPGGPGEVWAVTNRWSDVDTAAARQAGVAWGQDSGLDWEQKYAAWVQSLEPLEGRTFLLRTPFGNKTLPAPTLDCGEVAYTLRVAFASWYHLPFFVQGWDAERRQPVYAGHFGFATRDGDVYPGFPAFRDRYTDYERSWHEGDAWPQDTTLRKRRLGDDDGNDFLEGLGAGAYFDEIFLNKRVGHFARLLLLYYGSVNLADGSNMIHVEADAIQAGDTLLKRDKKIGTGHTVPILNVKHPLEGKVAVEVASGNIPRRQPRWEDTLVARHRFTSNYYGGEGTNSKGEQYAALGGGLRRWRTATLDGNRWNNLVFAGYREARIADDDYERIGSRPKRFDEILLSGTPEERIATALANVQSMREHLREHPASCSARINREDAFANLYDAAEGLGQTKEQVDAEHRTLEDYVFGELIYEQSKTCCWNSTTKAMADIVLDYAAKEQAQAEQDQTCISPTVFRARADGYELWRQHAISMGMESAWVAWSEDESCPQRDVSEDSEQVSRPATAWCSLPTP